MSTNEIKKDGHRVCGGQAQGFRPVRKGNKETIEPVYGIAEFCMFENGNWYLEVKEKDTGSELYCTDGKNHDTLQIGTKTEGILLYKNLDGADEEDVLIKVNWPLGSPTSKEAERMYRGLPKGQKSPQFSLELFTGNKDCPFLLVWWHWEANGTRTMLWDDGFGTLDDLKGEERQVGGYELDYFDRRKLTFPSDEYIISDGCSDGLQFGFDDDDDY